MVRLSSFFPFPLLPSKNCCTKPGFVQQFFDGSNGKGKEAAAYILKMNSVFYFFKSSQSKLKNLRHKFYADVHQFWTDLQQIDNLTSHVVKNQAI